MLTNEELQLAINSGIINLPEIEAALIMAERKQYLEKHNYKTYHGNDGRWYTHFPDSSKKNGRKLVSRKTKQELDDYIISYYKDKESNPTLDELFGEWNNHRLELGKISYSTYTRNKQIYQRFFSDGFGKRNICGIATYEIQDFLEEQISKHNLSSKSFSNLKTIIRGILKRAKKLKYISYNIEEMINDLDVSDHCFKKQIINDEKEVFFDDEMYSIIDYCKEQCKKDSPCLGIVLMFATGMRVGEIVALKHEDVDYDNGIIKVRRTESRYIDKDTKKYCYEVKDYPKTPAGIRNIVVPDYFMWVLDIMKSIKNNNEYVFTNIHGRLKTQAVRKRLYQICDKLNIPVRSPHKVRKTYGSILLDNNVDNNFVLQQMGHTEILTTEKHYHRNRKRIDEKRKIVNEIAQFS